MTDGIKPLADIKTCGFIMLMAGACVGAPIAQFARGEWPDPLILLFILATHGFAAPIAFRAFKATRYDSGQGMLRVMIVLGYLAGIGCGVALIVT